MAREVNAVLVQIIAEFRGKSEAKAEEIVKNMRAANQYQVCVYHFFVSLARRKGRLTTPFIGGCMVIKNCAFNETTFLLPFSLFVSFRLYRFDSLLSVHTTNDLRFGAEHFAPFLDFIFAYYCLIIVL